MMCPESRSTATDFVKVADASFTQQNRNPIMMTASIKKPSDTEGFCLKCPEPRQTAAGQAGRKFIYDDKWKQKILHEGGFSVSSARNRIPLKCSGTSHKTFRLNLSARRGT